MTSNPPPTPHERRPGSAEEPQRPLLRIVRGNPDDAELAALTAVVAGLTSSAGEPAPREERSRWADPASRLRRPLRPGPGAWRWSASAG